MNFKVSVIMPVLNSASYLRRAVESALALTEVGEIIIIDDGSQDGSVEIAAELSITEERVKFLQHSDKKNYGPAVSRNLGIQNSTCDYIAFLDADDYYLPTRFLKEKQIFEARKDIDGVYGYLKNAFESEESKILFHKHSSDVEEGLAWDVSPENLFNKLLFFGGVRICLPVFTVKKKTLLRVSLFNTHLRWSEDTELWLKLSIKAKLVAGDVENPGCIRWVHGSNSIHQIQNVAEGRRMMYQSLFVWGLSERLSFDNMNSLFNALLCYSKPENYWPLKLLTEQLCKYPKMIGNIFFWKKLHLLCITNKAHAHQ